MRRIFLALLLLACSVQCFCQTDIYKKYAGRTDIRVASVNNFTLDTGITADVTSLEAMDDLSWEWICQEFSLVPPTPDQQQQLNEGVDVVYFAQRDPSDPTKPVVITEGSSALTSSCYLGASYLGHKLYIFSCHTDRQSDVIVNYLIEKMRRK